MESKEKLVIERILKFCEFDYLKIKSPQKGYRNTSYPVVLKDKTTINIILFKHEKGILKRIRQADKVSDALAEKGYPTRKSLSPVITLKDENITRYARCYSYLPGKTIPWEAYTMKHIKLLGQTMAEIHQASKKIIIASSTIEECLHLSQQMDTYFQQNGVKKALKDKLKMQIHYSHNETVRDIENPTLKRLRNQIVHMDFVRGNILFEASKDPKISGIIDFEKTSSGPVLFDLARTLAFLVVDCKFKDPHKVYKYFINSGYIKRGEVDLNTEQLQLLLKLTRFYLTYDFYKFLKHNPYESLLENEHFVRTRDFLLQEDGMISNIEHNGTQAFHLKAN